VIGDLPLPPRVVLDDYGERGTNMATRAGTATKRQGIEALTKRKAWKALQIHHKQVRELHFRNLFADDPGRGERMTAEAIGVFLDYSKNRITDETLKLLFQLAEESDLRGRIDAMFRGEKINITENRAVLHVALRAPRGASILVDGEDVVPPVHDVLGSCSSRLATSGLKGSILRARLRQARACRGEPKYFRIGRRARCKWREVFRTDQCSPWCNRWISLMRSLSSMSPL
jgi:hypothetical protein